VTLFDTIQLQTGWVLLRMTQTDLEKNINRFKGYGRGEVKELNSNNVFQILNSRVVIDIDIRIAKWLYCRISIILLSYFLAGHTINLNTVCLCHFLKYLRIIRIIFSFKYT